MGFGGHRGVMPITRVVQSCHLGNKAEFVLGPPLDYESPKKVHRKENFQVGVLNTQKCQIDYRLNSLVDSAMEVYYITQVCKQGVNIKTVCPNYKLELRSTQSHLYCKSIQERGSRQKLSSKSMSVKLLVIALYTCQAISQYVLFNARQLCHLQQLLIF